MLREAPLIPLARIKALPKGVEIYQFDTTALGSRRPLLLVHGLLGEYHPRFRWQKLADYLNRDATFHQQYKIYLARYDSHASLDTIADEFKVAFRQLAPAGRLTVVAISLSGAIIRHAMSDPAVEKSIDKVLTMGSFFRGSPLFCSDWMQKSIHRRHVLAPFFRLDRGLGYKLYFARHRNLNSDYAWDNVDGQMPSEFYPQSVDSAISRGRTAEREPGDAKFVVYAGFLRNEFVPRRHGAVRTFLVSPVTFLRTTVPTHLGAEHAALRFLNYLIADVLPKEPGSDAIVYPLNDGISPVSSSLLLTNEFVSRAALNSLDALQSIRGHSNARKARLFDDIDHLTFIEEQRPRGSETNIADVLSPDEPARPMFAWILKDLLD